MQSLFAFADNLLWIVVKIFSKFLGCFCYENGIHSPIFHPIPLSQIVSNRYTLGSQRLWTKSWLHHTWSMIKRENKRSYFNKLGIVLTKSSSYFLSFERTIFVSIRKWKWLKRSDKIDGKQSNEISRLQQQ